KADNIPLEEVMMKIQKQKGYAFFFRGSNIAEIPISAELNTNSLEKAMDVVLSGHGLEWSVKDETIIIKRPEISEAAPKSSAQTTRIQQTVVTGKVVDEAGNPLEGVTVTAGETGKGTTSDANGDYRIEIPTGTDRLSFAAVGYHRTDEPIVKRKVINVTLEVALIELEEVVVAGYVTVKKGDLTGAVGSLKSEDFIQGVITTVQQMMQGKKPGVQVV